MFIIIISYNLKVFTKALREESACIVLIIQIRTNGPGAILVFQSGRHPASGVVAGTYKEILRVKVGGAFLLKGV